MVVTNLADATVIATDQTLKQSMANQARRYVNVKGFGATGNGSDDDLDAINAAIAWRDDVVTTPTTFYRGTLYFPRGTYRIRAPITVPTNGMQICMEGEPGTIITGHFNDFLIKYQYSDVTDSGSQRGVIERFRLINTHSTGGGIRYGTCSGGTIRDCIITANRGIYCHIRTVGSTVWIPFEVSIFNCHLDPGSNPTGSVGIFTGTDGPIANCTFTGFATGAAMGGGNGGMNFIGCKFEECVIGYATATANWLLSGCRFVNCSTAIHCAGGGRSLLSGIQIEAATGTIAGDPQYGLRVMGDGLSGCVVGGVNITGDYAAFGVDIANAGANPIQNLFAGIGANNDWGTDTTTPNTGQFIACDRLPLLSFANLQARKVSAASWSAGVVTLTIPSFLSSSGNYITVTGVEVGGDDNNGYNGTFLLASGTTSVALKYDVAVDPGPADTPQPNAAAVKLQAQDRPPCVFVGDTYNITNSNTSVWGAAVNQGAPNDNVKVRWNGVNWTVVGK